MGISSPQIKYRYKLEVEMMGMHQEIVQFETKLCSMYVLSHTY